MICILYLPLNLHENVILDDIFENGNVKVYKTFVVIFDREAVQYIFFMVILLFFIICFWVANSFCLQFLEFLRLSGNPIIISPHFMSGRHMFSSFTHRDERGILRSADISVSTPY